MYNVDFFIQFFSSIPTEAFTIGILHDDSGNHCANGWCGVTSTSMYTPQPAMARALQKVFSPLCIHYAEDGMSGEVVLDFPYTNPGYSQKAAIIQNGESQEYTQPTPKERILAALLDVKNMDKDGDDAVEETKKIIEDTPVTA